MGENIKKGIKLIVDSSVDIPKDILDANDVYVMRYQISIGGKSYQDGLDITQELLFSLVNKHKELPKTSAMGPALYEETFAKFANDYESVILIGLGSDFSSSFSSACLAAKEFDNVHVIDSCNLSTGTGLLVLKIIKFIKEGMSTSDIISTITEMTKRVKTQFCVDNLKHLHMGGRCRATVKYIATALRIKPIIAVIDGKMDITKKPIGYKKALNLMYEQTIENKDNIDLDCIMITHATADEEALELKERLSKYFNKDIIMITKAGATISTHCGPKTLGILYILKK